MSEIRGERVVNLATDESLVDTSNAYAQDESVVVTSNAPVVDGVQARKIRVKKPPQPLGPVDKEALNQSENVGENGPSTSSQQTFDPLAGVRAARTAVVQLNSLHGNPTGVELPRSPSEMSNGQNANGPEGSPAAVPPNPSEETMKSDQARQLLNQIQNGALEMIYECARHRLLGDDTPIIDELVEQYLRSIGRDGDSLMFAVVEKLLRITEERAVKAEDRRQKIEKYEEALQEWEQLHRDTCNMLQETQVQMRTLQAIVDAQAGRSVTGGLVSNNQKDPQIQSNDRKPNFENLKLNQLDELFNALPPRRTQTQRTFPPPPPLHQQSYHNAQNQYNQNQYPALPVNAERSRQSLVRSLEEQQKIDSRVRTLKLEPKFSGVSRSADFTEQNMAIFEHWFTKVQGQISEGSEEAQLTAIITALVGPAYQTYMMLSDEQKRDFNFVITRLKDTFKSRLTREEIRSQLNSLKMKSEEDFRSYHYRCVYLFNMRKAEFGEPLREFEKKETLLAGLPYALAERIKERVPTHAATRKYPAATNTS
jgi:hypothetical protein